MLLGNGPVSLILFFIKSAIITGIIFMLFYIISNTHAVAGKWEVFALLLFLPTLILIRKSLNLFGRK
jgi:hypothetical protein